MASTLSPRTPRGGPRRSLKRQGGWWQWAIPAAIGAINLLSGKRAADQAEEGQRETNELNAQLAREQMTFQERMSSTAYQRGVQDMKSAGLNPMLAYSQGGASAPQGQTATMQNPQAQASQIRAQAVSSSAQSAMGIMSAYQNMELQNAQTQKTNAETAQTIASTLAPEVYRAQGYSTLAKTNEEGNKLGTSANLDQQMINNLVAEYTGIEARSARDQAQFNEMKNRGGFAADVEKRKAEAESARYGVSEAKSTSEFFQKAGSLPKWLQLILHSIRSIK